MARRRGSRECRVRRTSHGAPLLFFTATGVRTWSKSLQLRGGLALCVASFFVFFAHPSIDSFFPLAIASVFERHTERVARGTVWPP